METDEDDILYSRAYNLYPGLISHVGSNRFAVERLLKDAQKKSALSGEIFPLVLFSVVCLVNVFWGESQIESVRYIWGILSGISVFRVLIVAKKSWRYRFLDPEEAITTAAKQSVGSQEYRS